MIFAATFATGFLLMCLILAWLGHCNDRTFAQRIRMIDEIAESARPDWRVFESVTYDKHLWTLATFRDWLRLYRESEAKR